MDRTTWGTFPFRKRLHSGKVLTFPPMRYPNEYEKKEEVLAMHTIHALRQKIFLSIVLFSAAVFLAACGTNTGGIGTGTTVSPTPTLATVRGYGTAHGCPNDVVVSATPTAPDVKILPEQGARTINAHKGNLLEIQMPFGVVWEGPTTSQGALQLQSPYGYAWKESNACIWRFIAKDTGTVGLDFYGRAICKKVTLCTPSVSIASFTIKVS